jgi:hypothetical protein
VYFIGPDVRLVSFPVVIGQSLSSEGRTGWTGRVSLKSEAKKQEKFDRDLPY